MPVYEERVKIVSDIVRSVSYNDWYKTYIYPDISQKTLTKITKEFDPNINSNLVAAFIDTSFSHNGKVGTVFTLTGLYDRQTFGRPIYINYADIKGYNILPNEDDKTEKLSRNLEIILDDDSKHVSYNEGETLAQILDKLLPVVMAWKDEYGHREAGVIGKYGLSDRQLKKCHAVIHSASVAAGAVGTGLAQIPLADSAIITPIQVSMIGSLGIIFDLHITEGVAKGVIGSVGAAIAGRSLAQLLVGWIPGIGNAINTATAAGLTEAIGWVAVKHFTKLSEADRAKYRIEGMKAGYEAASDEYEAKLRKQAKEFIEQKRAFGEKRDQYEKLLDEYEKYISVLDQQIELLKNAEGLEVPQYLTNNFEEMTDELAALRKLKENS